MEAQPARFNVCDVQVRAGDSYRPYASQKCPPLHVAVEVPDGLPEGALSVQIKSYDNTSFQAYELRHVIPSNATQFTPTLPDELITFDAPANGSSGKASQILIAHRPFEHALGVVSLEYLDSAVPRRGTIKVYSGESAVPLARVLAAGVSSLAPAGDLTWSLAAVGDFTTVDEYLAPDRVAAAAWNNISTFDPAGHGFSYSAD